MPIAIPRATLALTARGDSYLDTAAPQQRPLLYRAVGAGSRRSGAIGGGRARAAGEGEGRARAAGEGPAFAHSGVAPAHGYVVRPGGGGGAIGCG